MDCACVWVDNEGGPEFMKTTTPIARKEHLCSECRRDILKGEKYRIDRGVWDGEFSSHKICLDCLSLREEFFCDGWTYEHIWDDMHMFINECRGDIGDDRLANLTPNTIEKIEKILIRYEDS